MGADDQLVRPRCGRGLGGALVRVEAIGAQDRAFHQTRHDRVVDSMRNLPSQPLGTELERTPINRRRRNPGALGVEPFALAEPDQDHALFPVVSQCQVLELGSGLAALEQRRQLPVGEVMADRLRLEDTDDDRVGIGAQGARGGRGDLHRPHTTIKCLGPRPVRAVSID